MQTTRNRSAKGVTGKEFASVVMKRFKRKAESVMDKYAHKLPHPELAAPIYSYDHAGAHDSAEAMELLEKMGIHQDTSCRATLPSLSPDFHRVIEHAHGTACSAFNLKLREVGTARDIEFYKALYKKTFLECVTASSVQKDVQGLKHLWQHVAAPEADGGSAGNWPKNNKLK